MSRLIDAEEVIFELNRMLNIVDERNARPDQVEEFKTIRTYVEWTKKVIHDTPTIDAVEVVRCENCKHCMIVDYYTSDDEKYVTMYHCKLYDNVLKNNNDFCNYGERREE